MGAWFDRLAMRLSNGTDASDFTLTPTLSLKGEGESKGPVRRLNAGLAVFPFGIRAGTLAKVQSLEELLDLRG